MDTSQLNTYIVSKKEWLLIRVGLSTSGYKPIEYIVSKKEWLLIVSKKEWLLIRVGLSTSGYTMPELS